MSYSKTVPISRVKNMYLSKILHPSSAIYLLAALLFLFTASTVSATKHDKDNNNNNSSTQPQLIHAVTGNVSTLTGSETASKNGQEALLTFHCYSKRDCAFAGPNATCFNYQCICDLGYLSVNAYCRKFNCTSNVDCRRRFYNTRCNNRYQKACVCDFGTHLDRYSQTCLFNGDDDLALKISLPISIFFVLLLTACVCCCCCKRRRQNNRAQQVQIASIFFSYTPVV